MISLIRFFEPFRSAEKDEHPYSGVVRFLKNVISKSLPNESNIITNMLGIKITDNLYQFMSLLKLV